MYFVGLFYRNFLFKWYNSKNDHHLRGIHTMSQALFQPFPENVANRFLQRLKEMLDRQRNVLHALTHSAPATYEALLKPLQDLEEELDAFFTPLSHLNSVMNTEATQEAYESALPLLSAFQSELTQNEALFEKIETIATDDAEASTVVDHTRRDFVLAGAKLNKEEKRRMKAIDLRLSELANTFSQNLLDATNHYELILDDPADVAELPQNDLDTATVAKEGKTHYRFTLQIPSYLAYMTYGSNRARREELYLAYHTRAPENAEVIDELLRLRHEKATLLGFENYATYALQTRDADNENKIIAFLEELRDAALPQAHRELDALKVFAYEIDGIDDLAPHDVAYYSEKLKKTTFDFDDAMTKPYFEQSRAVDGLLSFVSDLFGVTFKPINVTTWHDSVRVFDLMEGGNLSGRLYFDLEARSEKRGGAWMHNWETHFTDTQGLAHLPSAFIVANFPAPTQNTPSLLRHDDVVTLFHEMGHAIHHLFGRSNERNVSGIHGVAWDVIEFPSQFLENFAYEGSILRRFAVHYETGEPIPDSLIAKIKQAKNFQAALGILRQVEFSLFDFHLHQTLYQGEQVQALLDLIREQTALLPPPAKSRFQHGFAHIFAGGYAAGYYSYKWAEVLSADAFFNCLNEEGNFDRSRARDYRMHILSRGGSQPMRELFQKWLGQKTSVKSLLHLYDIDEK
jgi:oligopeptidase A